MTKKEFKNVPDGTLLVLEGLGGFNLSVSDDPIFFTIDNYLKIHLLSTCDRISYPTPEQITYHIAKKLRS